MGLIHALRVARFVRGMRHPERATWAHIVRAMGRLHAGEYYPQVWRSFREIDCTYITNSEKQE